jgi:hypothetical protein
MLMSSHLLQSCALPALITRSTTSTRPPLAIADRQFSRIRVAFASSQSWMMYFIKYASAPAGTRSKKLPGITSQWSATLGAVTYPLAAAFATTCG